MVYGRKVNIENEFRFRIYEFYLVYQLLMIIIFDLNFIIFYFKYKLIGNKN